MKEETQKSKLIEGVEQILDVLAKKFGSTTEHLWAFTVKEQKLQAVSGFVYPLALIALGIFLFHLAPNNSDGDFLWWFLPFLGAGAFFASISVAQSLWVQSQNPEYSALESIISLIKGKDD